MRFRALLIALLTLTALTLSTCGASSGTPHARLQVRPTGPYATVHGARLRVKLIVKPAGSASSYDATLSWNIPAFPATTGYYTFRDGSQVGSPAGSPYVFQSLACGTTYTLGVQAHNGSGGTGPVYSTRYSTPACAIILGPSCTRYVATAGNGGNDANNGTAGNPVATLTRANALASAGQVWCIGTGTYTGSSNIGVSLTHSGSAGNVITYCGTSDNVSCATTGQPATFNATATTLAGGNGVIQANALSYVTIQGVEVENSNHRGFSFTGDNQHIVLDRNLIHDVQEHAIESSGTVFTISNNTVYNATLQNTSDALGAGGWTNDIGVTCPFNPYPTCSPSASSSFTITGNLIYNSWGEGIDLEQVSNSTVSGNTVHDVWSVCIYVNGIASTTVTGNNVYASGSTYNRGGKGCVGIELANELSTDQTLSSDTVANNLVSGGTNTGIEYFQYAGSNGYAGLTVDFNTVYGASATAINMGAAGTTTAGSPTGTLKNNIVCSGSSGGAWTPDSNGSWTITNDDWPNAACTGTGSLPTGVSGSGNTTVSPVMLAPSAAAAPSQFALTGSSPSAVTQGGTPIGSLTTDYFGATRNVSTPSIGFDEYPH